MKSRSKTRLRETQRHTQRQKVIDEQRGRKGEKKERENKVLKLKSEREDETK